MFEYKTESVLPFTTNKRSISWVAGANFIPEFDTEKELKEVVNLDIRELANEN